MTKKRPEPVHDFFIEDLRVLSIEASAQPAKPSHLSWDGSFGPYFEENGPDGMQLLFMTLHGGSSTGRASITVGGIVTPAREIGENLIDALIGSSALETLYDFARSSIRQVTAPIGAKIKFPYRSPVAELYSISSSDDHLDI